MVGGYLLKVDARHGIKGLFPASEGYFVDRSLEGPLQATCWGLAHLFQLRLQMHPLTTYHLEDEALARCTALLTGRASAASDCEQLAGRLLAAAFRPTMVKCAKGRLFDRASQKLSQLTKFDTNELVSTVLKAMAVACCAFISRPASAVSPRPAPGQRSRIDVTQISAASRTKLCWRLKRFPLAQPTARETRLQLGGATRVLPGGHHICSPSCCRNVLAT